MSSPRPRPAALVQARAAGSSPQSTSTPIPDDTDADASLPLTTSASVVLSALPTDAQTALARVDDMEGIKVKVRFHVIGDAPTLSQQTFKISATNRFEAVVGFLRRRLGLRPEQSILCYINRVFSPGLDEGVGGLWKCFKGGDDQLNIWYSMTPAFG